MRSWVMACLTGGLLAGRVAALEYRVDLIQLDPWAFANDAATICKGNPETAAGAPIAGIIADLLAEFERRSGHITNKTLTPYLRVELDLEKGNTDFTIMAWAERRAVFASKGVTIVPLDFGVRARKGVSIKSYGDLKGITTSATRGLHIDARFDADNTLRKDMVVDYSTGVRKTAANHGSQAVAGSLAAINYIIKKMHLQDQFGDTLVLGTVQLTVAFSKKSPLLGTEEGVNAVFRAMVDDGTAAKIVDKWLK